MNSCTLFHYAALNRTFLLSDLHSTVPPHVAAEGVALLLRIRKVAGSNLGQTTGHSARGFPASYANARTVLQIRPRRMMNATVGIA
jgi:hypothetical protein